MTICPKALLLESWGGRGGEKFWEKGGRVGKSFGKKEVEGGGVKGTSDAEGVSA